MDLTEPAGYTYELFPTRLKIKFNLFAIAYLPTLLLPTQLFFFFCGCFFFFFLFFWLVVFFFFFFCFFFAVSIFQFQSKY